MATAQQIKSLLKSYSDSDGDTFLSVALQIAAHEARSGNGNVANELKKLVDEIREKQKSAKIGGAVPISRPTGQLAGLLAVTYPKTRLNEMVLPTATRNPLELAVREYLHQSRLRGHGLSARRKLLLVGPPGCGKTMSASALAGELKLPLFSVQLHGLITKFMGETAAKLNLVFEAMKQTRGVYFFDEFDAIGADRGSKNDVGEVRRILNSFLQFLEQDESESLVIAATNLESMLDEALFRRFDDVIRYIYPTVEEAEQLIKNRLAVFLPKRFPWKKVIQDAAGLSHAEIARACDDAAKMAILNDQDHVSFELLIQSLQQRKRLGGATRLNQNNKG